MEKPERLVTYQTMSGVLLASRNGLSKERRETVLKRCKAQQEAMREIWAKNEAATTVDEDRVDR